MGRELRRKEERKNNNNKKNKSIKRNQSLDTSIKGSTIAKIVIFTILILLVLYYIIAVFITKEINISWSNDNETTENNASSSVLNKILAKNIFNQSEETYYVYFYDFSDADSGIASAINNSDLTIYRVDTGSALNQNYVTEDDSNRNATSISDLKVKNPTLIKVSADQITAYYEGRIEILDFLG